MESTIMSLIIIAIVASIVVFIASSGIFIMWIYYSWIRRTNSANYNGVDLTEKMFKKAQINPEIKNSLFYIKYWNNNKKRNTYRLRPWTYYRKSIWTMMEASQQAYATIIRNKQPRAFWMAFRLPGFVKIGGSIIGISLFIYTLFGINNRISDLDVSKLNVGQWFLLSLSLGIIIISFLISEVWMIWILRRDVPKYLKDSGLNEMEIKAIKRIFTWRLVYAIARVILEILRILIQIASRSNSSKSKR